MIQKNLSRYYISLEEATKLCDYSQEYLSLRARTGKLKAKKIGRNWVTTEEWLKKYLSKTEEYNSRLARSAMSELSPVGTEEPSLPVEPPDNLPTENFQPNPPRADRAKELIFGTIAIVFFIASGIFFYNFSAFKGYVSWAEEKTGFSVFGKEFYAFGKWTGGEFSKFQQFVFNKLSLPSWPFLTKGELVEVEEKQTKTIIDKFVEELGELKKFGGREIIKEVKKITEVTPVKEITKETIRVDEEALKQLREQMVYFEDELSKRLYAPGGVITQQIYIKEPIQSPKIYQENGEIVLQTLGSGNVILSAATGLQLYGKQVVIESTSLLSPLIYLASNTRIGGNLTVTGSISGGALSVSSIAASGNATVGGNLSVLGNITVDGFLTSNATITAAAFVSAATNSTVRKSGEEVFREIIPIDRYDIPAQTGTTNYFRISKSFGQNPLAQTPEPLPGATRVYKLIIKYDDNIPANSSSSWRIYRPSADTTSDSFVLLGRNSDKVVEGIATTTQNLTIPDTDWRVDVKLSEADAGKTLRVFQIFLAAFDKIN